MSEDYRLGATPLARAVRAFNSVLTDAAEQLSEEEHKVFLQIVFIRFARQIAHYFPPEVPEEPAT